MSTSWSAEVRDRGDGTFLVGVWERRGTLPLDDPLIVAVVTERSPRRALVKAFVELLESEPSDVHFREPVAGTSWATATTSEEMKA